MPNVNPREGQPAPLRAAKADLDLDEIKEQIVNLTKALSPIKETVAAVADKMKDKKDPKVPADVDKSLKMLHSRLDKIENQVDILADNQKRMATTFSSAIMALTDKIEKIAGGEDSEFSLSHSLEKLIDLLSNRKLKIVRNNDGDMVGVETV